MTSEIIQLSSSGSGGNQKSSRFENALTKLALSNLQPKHASKSPQTAKPQKPDSVQKKTELQSSSPKPATSDHRPYLNMLAKLVSIDTSASVEDAKVLSPGKGTATAVQTIASQLIADDVSKENIEIFRPDPDNKPNKANLVVRVPGAGKAKKKLFICHLDGMPAIPGEWTMDVGGKTVQLNPYEMTEVGNKLYGRAIVDNKSSGASYYDVVRRMKNENYVPAGDLYFMFTTDEETQGNDGLGWLIKNKPHYFNDVAFAINENGGDELQNGKPARQNMQVAEKSYQTFDITAQGEGSHSALPKPADTNANNRLAKAITSVSKLNFPIQPIPVVLAYFEKVLPTETPATQEAIKFLIERSKKEKTPVIIDDKDIAKLKPLLDKPEYNALLRDTCVTTMLKAGEAENGVPVKATATYQCRLLPGHKVSDMHQDIVKAIDDPNVTVTLAKGLGESPASPLNPKFTQAVENISADMWPGVPLIPVMSAGASDAKHLRRLNIPVYGLMGLFLENEGNAHAPKENGGKKELLDSNTFIYRLAKETSGL